MRLFLSSFGFRDCHPAAVKVADDVGAFTARHPNQLVLQREKDLRAAGADDAGCLVESAMPRIVGPYERLELSYFVIFFNLLL